MREYEKHSFTGATYLLVATLFIVWFFPYPIVSLSLIFVAVADPLASFVGIRFGRDKLIGQKSLQGSVAAFLACAVIAAIYYSNLHIMTDRLLLVSLLSGFIGAAAELIPVGRLDDNVTLPVLSALGLWVLFTLFGALQ